MCKYTKIGRVYNEPTRMKYRSSCGLEVTQVDYERFDGKKT